MPNWPAELVGERETLRKALADAFGRLSPEFELPDRAPVPTVILKHKNELAGFSITNGDARNNYRQAYAFFRKLYQTRHTEWDALNLSFVLCLVTERRDPEIEALCRDIEGDVYFCRKFALFLRGRGSYNLARLPFVPLRYDATGFQRPASAQSELTTRGVPPDLAEAIVVQYRRSADGILEDCMAGKHGAPKLHEQVAKTFREPSSLAAPNRLVSLEICNFRAYRTPEVFDMSGDVVLLYGQNGLGKTSLYDAIDFCATGGIGRLKVDEKAFRKVARHLDSKNEPSYVKLTFQSATKKQTITRHVDSCADASLDGKTATRKATLSALTGLSASAGADRVEHMVNLFRATHLFSQEFPILAEGFKDNSELSSEVISRLLAFEDFVNAGNKLSAIRSEFDKWVADRKERARNITNALAREKEELAKLQTAQAVTQDVGMLDSSIAELQALLKEAQLGIAIQGRPDREHMRSIRGVLEAERSRLAGTLNTFNSLLANWPSVQTSRASMALNANVSKEKRAELVEAEKRLLAEREILNRSNAEIEAIQKRLLDLQHRASNLAWWRDARVEHRLLEEQLESLKTTLQQVRAARDKGISQLNENSQRMRELEGKLDLTNKEQEELAGELAALDDVISRYNYWQEQSANRRNLTTTLNGLGEQLTTLQAKLRAAALRRHEQQAQQQAAATNLAKLQGDSSALAKLLVALEGHVVSGHCPACGHDHGSKHNLLIEMRRVRQQSSEVTGAAQQLAEASSALEITDKEIREHQALAASLEQQIGTGKAQADNLSGVIKNLEELALRFGVSLDSDGAPDRFRERKEQATQKLVLLRENIRELADAVAKARGQAAALKAAMPSDNAVAEHEQSIVLRMNRLEELKAQAIRRNTLLDAIHSEMEHAAQAAQQEIEQTKGRLEELLSHTAEVRKREAFETKLTEGIRTAIQRADAAMQEPQRVIADWEASCALVELPKHSDVSAVDAKYKSLLGRATLFDQLRERVLGMERALDAVATSAEMATRRAAIDTLERDLASTTTEAAQQWSKYFAELAESLEKVQDAAVTSYTDKFGPIASILQQRLRSVFGFEDIELKAVDGHIQVRVNRNGEPLRPTDYFSQSQQQILLLSLFFTACSTQNWSSFAPVLLDDPVTHFDDLNAYAFLDLVAGLVETEERRQFVISTCEERFFKLAQQKLQHLGDRLKIHKFVSLHSSGPVIEQISLGTESLQPTTQS